MYSKVRDYIDKTIRSYDKKFKAHEDAFNRDNIPSTILDHAYHVEYSANSISNENDGLINSSVEASVNFYFKGYRSPQKALDKAMDKVGFISLELSSIASVTAFRQADDSPIQSCYPTSQIPSFLSHNDNDIIIELTLNLELLFNNC